MASVWRSSSGLQHSPVYKGSLNRSGDLGDLGVGHHFLSKCGPLLLLAPAYGQVVEGSVICIPCIADLLYTGDNR